MRSLIAVCVSVSVATILMAMSYPQAVTEDPLAYSPDAARVLAEEELEAVIMPLPDEVSNGTWWYLDAKNSTYSNGTIDQYEWLVYLKGVLKNIYTEPGNRHMFRQLGLWKITLTITTNDSKTAKAFTAVYSVPDSDGDRLDDWWELHYFTDMNQTGDGDYDNDGFSNLQEFASDMNPTSKDPGALLAAIVENWYIIVAAVAIAAVAIAIYYPKLKKKRKADVKKQIDAAIEIEKALEEEEK
jgi:hypothetical protein